MTTLKDMVELCDECGDALEIGQIGLCDGCRAERDDYQGDESCSD